MTEIPEHLLKRSKSAKAKASGEEPSEADAVETTAVAAVSTSVATSAAPAVEYPNLDPEPEPEPPAPAYIQAAKKRKRMPVWAMPVVAILPLWALAYPGTMQEPETEDIVAIESELFYNDSGCAGCHGAAGAGGSGYKLSDGEVLQTFPNVADMMVHIVRGSAAIDGQEYGAPRADGSRRVSGARDQGAMPAQLGQISMIQLELIVYHERHTLSGEPADTPEYEEWVEHMREAWEDGGKDAPKLTEEDVQFLLRCADPAVTPGATGEGPTEERKCPGPQAKDASE